MTGRNQSVDITVLMGGSSSERDVSLVSGTAVADALEECGHAVTRADITPWHTDALDREGIDVVFIALHGDFGESGEVQRLCEARELCYTGSPPSASMFGMNKAASKQVFKREGLMVPGWAVIEEFTPVDEARETIDALGLPLVVKPVSGGSSVDVAVCRDRRAVKEAVEHVLDTYARVLVEAYIPGAEYTVGILGDEPLPVIQIVPAAGFYDYYSKYADEAETRYVFDHALDTETADTLKRTALAAHRVLGCRDFSRVDFILDADNVPWILEINTIPGFTSHSLLPKAAEKAGISFPALCDRIVRMAAERDPKRSIVFT